MTQTTGKSILPHGDNVAINAMDTLFLHTRISLTPCIHPACPLPYAPAGRHDVSGAAQPRTDAAAVKNKLPRPEQGSDMPPASLSPPR